MSKDATAKAMILTAEVQQDKAFIDAPGADWIDEDGLRRDGAELDSDQTLSLALGLGQLLEGDSAVCVAGTDGRILFANAAYRRLLPTLLVSSGAAEHKDGVPLAPYAEDMLARARTTPGDWSPWEERELRISLGGLTQAYISRHSILFSPDGEAKLVIVRYALANDEDILRRQLTAMRDRSEDIARMVSDWIWETDRDLRLTFLSNRVLEATGHHPRTLLGKPLTSLLSDPCQAIEDLCDEGGRQPFRNIEVTGKHLDGSQRIFRLSAVPVYAQDSGDFVGFRGTAQDVTALKMRESALMRSKEIAESASRSKSQFLATVSHELRTPLNAIIGFSEIMKGQIFGDLGNETYLEYATDIHQSAQHLLELINDILDVSKIEAGKLDLDEHEIDGAEIARSTMRLVAGRVLHNQIALRESLAESLPQLLADPRAIKQVLLNLLSNAIKFTPEGGQVELSAQLDGGGDFLFRVTDTGIGMSDSEIVTALTPFGQVDSRLSRKFEGTGLGLPLSRGLAQLHDGDLEFESRPGAGTCVTLRIPAKRVISEKA